MKDLTKYFIDLSKCTEEEQEYIFSLLPPREFDNQYRIDPCHFHLSFDGNSGWWVFNNTLGKTELTYPEFIKLFEGGATIKSDNTENLANALEQIEKLEVEKAELLEALETILYNSDVPNEIYDQTKSLIQKMKQ